MIVVWVEVSTFWNINTEWWRVVITGQQIVRIVDETWVMGIGLRQIWWPDTLIGVLSLMDSHVWWPHSIVNNSLSAIPFLEEVTSVFLMCWMHFWEVNHLLHKLVLIETLVDQKIILLMHGSVTALASSLENFKSSSKGSGVVRIPGLSRWPVTVSVMHTDGVDLLFITLDTVRGTYVISEEPSLRLSLASKERMSSNGSSKCAELRCLLYLVGRIHFFIKKLNNYNMNMHKGIMSH